MRTDVPPVTAAASDPFHDSVEADSLGGDLPKVQTARAIEPDARRFSAISVASLSLTVVLCLPSLLGEIALVTNAARRIEIGYWEQIPSAIIALGLLLGGPLVTLAAVLGGLTSLSHRVPASIKYAQLFLVSASVVATLALFARFA